VKSEKVGNTFFKRKKINVRILDDTYMEILSSLTCWVLLSVRTAEHTVAVATLEKFVGCMEELGATLGTFGKTLLQKEHVKMSWLIKTSF
jgi:hypothetical protein